MIKQDYILKIWDDGCQFFAYQKRLHRFDGPAVIWNDDREYYYVDGFCITKPDFYENYCKKHD